MKHLIQNAISKNTECEDPDEVRIVRDYVKPYDGKPRKRTKPTRPIPQHAVKRYWTVRSVE